MVNASLFEDTFIILLMTSAIKKLNQIWNRKSCHEDEAGNSRFKKGLPIKNTMQVPPELKEPEVLHLLWWKSYYLIDYSSSTTITFLTLLPL